MARWGRKNLRKAKAAAYGKFGHALLSHVVRLHFDHAMSPREILSQLNCGRKLISRTSVYRILMRFEKTGDMRTPRRGQRASPMTAISGDTWVYLRDTLDKYPSLFLDEMQDLLRARSGVRYPISTICYTLQRKHYTMRVLKQRALRRDREEEQRFIDVMSEYPGDFFIWVDETRKDPRSLVRRRGRGVRGFRTSVLERFSRTRGYSATGVFSLEGMIDFAISNVAGVHADLFLAMLSNCVIPHCLPFPGRHSIVVLDNASIHHDPRVRQMIKATGARLIFLPPYANDKNPIEEAFSKVKALLQRHRRFATDYPKLALGRALESITHVDAAGYIGHAGYSVEELIPGVLFSGGE